MSIIGNITNDSSNFTDLKTKNYLIETLDYIIDILYDISKFDVITVIDANNTIKIIDALIDLPESVLVQLQTDLNSLNRLVVLIEDIVVSINHDMKNALNIVYDNLNLRSFVPNVIDNFEIGIETSK